MITAGILPMLTASCTLKRKSFQNLRSGGAASNFLIIAEKVGIDRTGSQQAMVIRFKTRASAQCQLSIWPMVGGQTAKPSDPKTIGCSSSDWQTDFLEILRDIDAKAQYAVEIQAWSQADPGKKDLLVVFEEPAIDQLRDLIVARVNLPLHSGEIYRHRLDGNFAADQVSQKLSRELGCRMANNDPASTLSNAMPQTGLNFVESRGFVNSQGRRHPARTDRLQMQFDLLQSGLRWEWNYATRGENRSFLSKAGAEFQVVEASSKNQRSISQAQLDPSEDALDLASGQPLNLRWTTSELGGTAFVRVTIGENNQQLTCVFAADKNTGVIDAEFLRNAAAGAQPMMIALESTQVIDPQNGNPAWMVASYDWRSTKINRL